MLATPVADAAEAVARWWQRYGCARYPDAGVLLVLADAGGSNGCRPRLWKQSLQEVVANRYGLAVMVCHYPTGASKWNPVACRSASSCCGPTPSAAVASDGSTM